MQFCQVLSFVSTFFESVFLFKNNEYFNYKFKIKQIKNKIIDFKNKEILT